jgi:hypothetical protein
VRAGELDKVVLAHDLLAVADAPDARYLLAGRALPACWSCAVDGSSARRRSSPDASPGGHSLVAGAGGHDLAGAHHRRPGDALLARRRTATSTGWPLRSLVDARGRCARSSPRPAEPVPLVPA